MEVVGHPASPSVHKTSIAQGTFRPAPMVASVSFRTAQIPGRAPSHNPPSQATGRAMENGDANESRRKTLTHRADEAGYVDQEDTQRLAEVQQELRQLQARDREVRQHEQAHTSVGGVYASAPRMRYERGPDGRLYAVSGEVIINTQEVPGNPERTIAKLEKVIQAAMAPVDPSPQDIRVAVKAAASIARLRAEIAAQAKDDEQPKEASKTYPKLLGDRVRLALYARGNDRQTATLGVSVHT